VLHGHSTGLLLRSSKDITTRAGSSCAP
jgi:hypothetical protein